jgi:hypothetical protein
MSQYDFGTIDPYVTVGVELADMLNQWRDAIYSLQRGNTRPTFVVPGQLWINDSAGPTNWQLVWFVSPTVGDVPLFSLNTTTGAVTISASSGGTFNAAVLLAQAAASPSVQWNATGNPIDVKAWRMTVNGAGALVLSSYSDAGVLQNSITFNRDGTIGTPFPTWRRLGRVVTVAAQAAIDFTNLPVDINDLKFIFDVTPTTNAVDFIVQFYDNTGALDSTTGHYAGAVTLASHSQALASAPLVYGSAGTTVTNGIPFDTSANTRRVGNTSGIRGSGTISDIRAARIKGVDLQSNYLSDDSILYIFITGGGVRNQATAITGLRFLFGSSTFAAGGAVSLWGSP